ncbi:MAG: hypothetical protein HRU20_02675 [Pseudomonadales bacterium]|nr:hypothetical protein [Pseudomonadales bacterium]
MIDTGSKADQPLLHDFSRPITLVNNYQAKPALSYAYSSNRKAHNSVSIGPILGSDIIYNHGAMATNLVLKKSLEVDTTEMEIIGRKSQADHIAVGDILMLSDCSHALVFVVSSLHREVDKNDIVTLTVQLTGDKNNLGLVNTEAALGGHRYARGSQILLMNTYQYFIASTGEPYARNSLFRYKALGENTVYASELVPNIDSLQFR